MFALTTQTGIVAASLASSMLNMEWDVKDVMLQSFPKEKNVVTSIEPLFYQLFILSDHINPHEVKPANSTYTVT